MLFQKVIVVGAKETREKEARDEAGKVDKGLVFGFLFVLQGMSIHSNLILKASSLRVRQWK